MGEIVIKVNADRGTPIEGQVDITEIPGQVVAAGIPGISSAERATRAGLQQQKFEENKKLGITASPPQKLTPFAAENIHTGKDLFMRSTGSDESTGILNTPSSSTQSERGGKKSRRNKQKKKKRTRKQRKTYKNKTRKHSKKNNKKTIKQ